MNESIISVIAISVTNVITYFLGRVQGRKKTEAEVDIVQLDNLSKVVDFYKETFEDVQREVHKLKNTCTVLSGQVQISNTDREELALQISRLTKQGMDSDVDRKKLSDEIQELRKENTELKKEIIELNQLITKLNNK